MFDQCLYFNTTALARRLEREWSTAFRVFGLTPPQAFLLRTVLASPGILQFELADAMAISRPTTTRALDGLALKKLIVRRATDGDGRHLAVYPTAKALAIATQLDDASGKVSRRLRKRLGDQVFSSLVEDVRTVPHDTRLTESLFRPDRCIANHQGPTLPQEPVMLAMQYQFELPADYDMVVIDRRVRDKGHLFDDLPGLAIKAFLSARRGDARWGGSVNRYAPFYVWSDPAAMVDFLCGERFSARHAGIRMARQSGRGRSWTRARAAP